jgi:NDP-sugar pyrophosphorylase family protein
MKIDKALILAAGRGTRMGVIGKVLPKPMWPIFEKTLLYLSCCYARDIGIGEIFINAHHCKQEILTHIDNLSMPNINVLEEEDLLGVGGAVHNLNRHSQGGNVLIINSDLFIFPMKGSITDYLDLNNGDIAQLLSLPVESNSGYNKLFIENNYLKKIEQIDKKNTSDYYTYSGVSLVNMDLLDDCEGFSNFFESVADYKKKKVSVVNLKNCEYWDFGTISRYCDSLYRVIDNLNKSCDSKFMTFLNKNGAIFEQCVQNNSYGSKYSHTIDLTGKNIANSSGQIIFCGTTSIETDKKGIYYRDLFQPI